MEFKYQTLKNLSEKLLRGRKTISEKGLKIIDRCLVEYAEEIFDEAVILAEMSKKKRLSEVHIEHAVSIVQKRR